jgi:hypothetical protein
VASSGPWTFVRQVQYSPWASAVADPFGRRKPLRHRDAGWMTGRHRGASVSRHLASDMAGWRGEWRMPSHGPCAHTARAAPDQAGSRVGRMAGTGRRRRHSFFQHRPSPLRWRKGAIDAESRDEITIESAELPRVERQLDACRLRIFIRLTPRSFACLKSFACLLSCSGAGR